MASTWALDESRDTISTHPLSERPVQASKRTNMAAMAKIVVKGGNHGEGVK